ncbi:hypothetical protein EYZ11_010978 [Aspergillus tanneri]|uniref:Uncharacterized protein n=1 Tax=Aspergillus tanneri TaxID=1220188 RepID=A0A4S3J3Y9_9EURO|nr:uncharacterized protein ATNIH1004_009352 [Aspergillus tanneri]KAA8645135.1 hypothetical protein ATNIH1004_009352 [Aspergillus tanneri]THC89569.1 hypothetical protein EYZ11_010978 [Aspergillus tanneri]
MIPKIYYLVVCLLVALVAAGPVGKQGASQGQTSQSKPNNKYKARPSFDGLGSLGVKNMEFGGPNRFNGYAAHLKLKSSSSVTEADIAGLAEAAWWEMFDLYIKNPPKDKAKQKGLPTVMTALKVGDEVFLASSLKGGGYIYDRDGIAKLAASPDELRGKNEEFTSVLKEKAPDVMNALISCREGSIATTQQEQTSAPEKRGLTGKGPRRGGSTSSNNDRKTGTGQQQSKNGQGQRNSQGGSTSSNNDKKKGTGQQQSNNGQGQSNNGQGQSNNGQGQRNNQGGSTSSNNDKKKGTGQQQSNNGQGQSNNQGGSSTTGSIDQIPQGFLKHKNEGACGEVMASLEYYLLNPTKSLKNLPEKPTVVAWEEKTEKDKKNPKIPSGNVFKEGGGIKPPCDNTLFKPKDPDHGKSLTEEDGCGEGWGCKAFVGPKGLNFKVVNKTPTYLKKDQIEVLKDVPTFPVPK